jgi:hypothetical protein
MKRNVLLLFYLLISIMIFGQNTKNANQDLSVFFPQPKIDKRTELLSIVFRLAGNWEYNSNDFKVYTQDIHEYFDKFKDHPIISFASKLRMENGVSYDAVMSMAFHIGQPPLFTPIVEFNDDIPERRWGKDNAMKFIELLQDFYKVTDFEKFYNEHAELYTIAEENFLPVYKALKIDWYNQYYGLMPNGSFNVIICLGNGGSNYGGKVVFEDSSEDAFAIMGTWSIDSTDKPFYKTPNYLPTLIHEFNHSYVNPLIDKFSNQLENSGKIIYSPLENIMRRQAYGNWKTMICESVVRASVIRYMLKYDSYNAAKGQMISEIGNGFYWMQGLVNILYEYEHNRTKYPTLESFMPQIIQFYDKIAKESETMYEIKK